MAAHSNQQGVTGFSLDRNRYSLVAVSPPMREREIKNSRLEAAPTGAIQDEIAALRFRLRRDKSLRSQRQDKKLDSRLIEIDLTGSHTY
jgi:hypothetical protein